LQLDLGGEYAVACSAEFVLLSAMDEKSASELLVFAERRLFDNKLTI
jgi:hypothetical protein